MQETSEKQLLFYRVVLLKQMVGRLLPGAFLLYRFMSCLTILSPPYLTDFFCPLPGTWPLLVTSPSPMP